MGIVNVATAIAVVVLCTWLTLALFRYNISKSIDNGAHLITEQFILDCVLRSKRLCESDYLFSSRPQVCILCNI